MSQEEGVRTVCRLGDIAVRAAASVPGVAQLSSLAIERKDQRGPAGPFCQAYFFLVSLSNLTMTTVA
eukprot:1151887-Pelagomonas_calceolata.AAC.2